MYKVEFSVFSDLHMDEIWVSDGERRLDLFLNVQKTVSEQGQKLCGKTEITDGSVIQKLKNRTIYKQVNSSVFLTKNCTFCRKMC